MAIVIGKEYKNAFDGVRRLVEGGCAPPDVSIRRRARAGSLRCAGTGGTTDSRCGKISSRPYAAIITKTIR